MTLSTSFSKTYGPWAIITGASAGIGAEFSRQLAAAGLSVVLVARRAEKLHNLSEEIKSQQKDKNVHVKVVTADLATSDGRQAVLDATASLDVGLLVNNAGMELMGAFANRDLDAHQRMMDLNITALTALAHAFARRFVARNRADAAAAAAGEKAAQPRRSGIVMLSSMANAAMPYMSTYAASKAYVTALSGAMGAELADDRVDVMALEPGAVESEMYARAQQDFDFAKAGFQSMPASTCVEDALTVFEARRKTRYTPGMMNRVMMSVSGMLPENFATKMFAGRLKQALAPELVEYVPS